MEHCVICGKRADCINPLRMIQRSPLICSPECLQKQFDKDGMEIRDGEGGVIKIAPGNIHIQFPVESNEPYKIEFTWEKEQEDA